MKYPEGKLLKMFREHAGLTLAQVGSKIGVSKVTLSMLENGDADAIGEKKRAKLIEVLNKAIEQKREKNARVLAAMDLRQDASMAAICSNYVDSVVGESKALAEALAKAIGSEREKQINQTIESVAKQMEQEEREEVGR
jgi:transcriptional regulator with XRE-family HTH domain